MDNESSWLASMPYLALDPKKQPRFTDAEIKAAAEGWKRWEEERKARPRTTT